MSPVFPSDLTHDSAGYTNGRSSSSAYQDHCGPSPITGSSSACASTYAGDTPTPQPSAFATPTPPPSSARASSKTGRRRASTEHADEGSRRNSAGVGHSKSLPPHHAPTEAARDVLRKFLCEKESNYLKAWFHYFDRDQNRRITRAEFKMGMQSLRYPGDIEGLFTEICLDADEEEELTFEEIDNDEAQLWNSFRRWAGSKFSSGRDMIRQLKQAYRRINGSIGNQPVTSLGQDEIISMLEFTEGVTELGWDSSRESPGYEVVIFHALDVEHEGCLAQRELKWMEVEVRRHRQKEVAKRKAQRIAEHKAQGFQAMQAALLEFKATLKKTAGPLFRGWRRLLDPDGSMSVQRADLFKVCQKLNWKGDVRALWKALDHDGSGVSTLEELDPHCAQLLAHFKSWAADNFGPKPSMNLFRVFDKLNNRKLKLAQFVQECQTRGFTRKVKTLALWLDWQDKKYLVEEDLEFLDSWKPPAWLVATPNPAAAADFQNLLITKYGHFLKAWRGCMDKDNSNCCNWHEFQEAVRHIKFTGDVAGAWLCFDEDISGYITLKEIDAAAHNALVEFKSWADEEFGGVRSAFKVLDSDGSNELNYREFRGACRNYCFQGDIRSIFEALDQQGEQMLQYKEVVFLDDWETQLPASTEGAESQMEVQKQPEQTELNICLDYSTTVPGPGAYEVFSGFAATPMMPSAKHNGAFSFTKRREQKKMARSVGPARYDPSFEPIAGRKPAWSFGHEARGSINGMPKLVARTPRSASVAESSRSTAARSEADMAREMASPGPGSYELRPTYNGPKFSMRPRRMLRVHVHEKPQIDSRPFSH